MPTLTSYDDSASRREDLLDLIVNIDPTDTPMLSGFATATARATLHEWQIDTLAARADNAQVEGEDPTFPTLGNPTRLVNFTQILRKPFQVSDTFRAIDTAGYRDRFTYEAEKALKELSNDINLAVDRGSSASGNASTARRMDGVLNCVTTNGTTVASGTSLTEEIYNTLLQDIWDQGGDPDETFVGARVKRQISGFTGGATKNVDVNDRRLVNSVDVYESDFGLQKIFLDRDALNGGSSINSLVALQNDKFRTAWLRRPFLQNIAKTGDSVKAQHVAEVSLECLNEQSSGKLLGIIG